MGDSNKLSYWIYTGVQGLIAVAIGGTAFVLNRKSTDNYKFALRALPFHMMRFLLHIMVLVVSLYQVSEVILENIAGKEISWDIYSSIFLQIITTATAVYLTYRMEKQRTSFKYLVPPIMLSLNGVIANCAIASDGFQKPDFTWNARQILLLGIALVFFCVLLLDGITILTTACRAPEKIENDEYEGVDFSGIGMKHDGVHAFSKLSFSWAYYIVSLGNKRPIEGSDIFRLPKNLLAVSEASRIKSFLTKDDNRRNLSVALLQANAGLLARITLLCVIASAATMATTLCIYQIVDFASTVDTANWKEQVTNVSDIVQFFSNGFVASLTLALLLLVTSLTDNYALHSAHYIANKLGTGLQALIFEKTLRLKTTVFSSGLIGVGEIVNSTVTDCYNVKLPSAIFPDLVLMVTKASLGIVIQYFILGKAGFIICGLFFFFSVYLVLLKIQGHYRNNNLGHTDNRLKLTNELVSGMRYFKLQGWDEKFSQKVTAARNTEMRSWVKLQTVTRLAQLFLFTSPGVVLFLILYTYTLLSYGTLSATMTLASLSVMQNMISTIRTVANEGHCFVKGYVSCLRLDKFLQLPETPLEIGDLISTELVTMVN